MKSWRCLAADFVESAKQNQCEKLHQWLGQSALGDPPGKLRSGQRVPGQKRLPESLPSRTRRKNLRLHLANDAGVSPK
jgi:hypothetical protein